MSLEGLQSGILKRRLTIKVFVCFGFFSAEGFYILKVIKQMLYQLSSETAEMYSPFG